MALARKQITNRNITVTVECEQGLKSSVCITRNDKIVYTIFYEQDFHKSLWFIFTVLKVSVFSFPTQTYKQCHSSLIEFHITRLIPQAEGKPFVTHYGSSEMLMHSYKYY